MLAVSYGGREAMVEYRYDPSQPDGCFTDILGVTTSTNNTYVIAVYKAIA